MYDISSLVGRVLLSIVIFDYCGILSLVPCDSWVVLLYLACVSNLPTGLPVPTELNPSGYSSRGSASTRRRSITSY
jgi:hypothetical protein